MNNNTTQPREQADELTCRAVLQRLRGLFSKGVDSRLDSVLDEADAALAPVAAPEAPRTGDKPAKLPWRITDAPRKIVGADGATVANLTVLDLPNAELIVASVNQPAPLVPEVAASEQQASDSLVSILQEFVDYHSKPAGMTLETALSADKLGEFLKDVEGREKAMVQRARVLLATPAATTVCAPSCFYGDCPPCVEAGIVPGAATTASASGERQYCQTCDMDVSKPCADAECRATAPSRNAAPLDKAAEKEKFIKWGQVFHRNARSYTARDFDHGFLGWLAAKSDAAQASHAGAPIDAMSNDDLWHIACIVNGLCDGNLANVSLYKCITEIRAGFMDPDSASKYRADRSAATEQKEKP